MRTTDHVLTTAIAVLGLLGLSATAAGATGFEEFTVEEIGENTATCDFDGDGIYTDYWVTPEQTVMQKSTIQVDGMSGMRSVVIITVFDHVEYTADSATPEVFYNTARSVFEATVDDSGTLVTAKMRSVGQATTADGTVLYQGPGHFDFEIVDGEFVDYVVRGPMGPCVPGI